MSSRKKESKVEDEKYWADRKVDDTRLDWRNGAGGWIEEYVASEDHPHRTAILDTLKDLWPFIDLLEIGCNAGPNISLIQKQYPDLYIAGVDINPYAILRAREVNPKPTFIIGSATNLPFENSSFDVVLCDAVLIYADPEVMEVIADEIRRVGRKYVVLVEWFSQKEKVENFHWVRNYDDYFGPPLVQKGVDWPTSSSWKKYGKLSVYRLPSRTGD